MGNLMKVLTSILGILAVIACLATIGIIGYSLSGAGSKNNQAVNQNQGDDLQPEETAVPTAVPDSFSEENSEGENVSQPVNLAGHSHDYKESMVKKATCYQAGQLKYTCECGDVYYVDVPSTGHVGDDWEITRQPTEKQDGLRVKKCIYCDEIVAMEAVPRLKAEKEAHTHQYTVSTEREPSCVLAGLRKYSCSCGSFYTEPISASGHIATDWTVVEEPTYTTLGREQRTCTVCGVILDSRPIAVLEPTPTPSPSSATATPTPTQTPTPSGSASPAATASSATPSPTPTATPSPSPTPTATPHTHNYVSYILKEANCTEKGVRSFVCTCGSTYAEEIEPDANKHSFQATVIPATETTQGYTIYRCVRCNYSYNDNYTPALTN